MKFDPDPTSNCSIPSSWSPAKKMRQTIMPEAITQWERSWSECAWIGLEVCEIVRVTEFILLFRGRRKLLRPPGLSSFPLIWWRNRQIFYFITSQKIKLKKYLKRERIFRTFGGVSNGGIREEGQAAVLHLPGPAHLNFRCGAVQFHSDDPYDAGARGLLLHGGQWGHLWDLSPKFGYFAVI